MLINLFARIISIFLGNRNIGGEMRVVKNYSINNKIL